MKSYRLTDPKSIQNAINKLLNKPLNSVPENKEYQIVSVVAEKDIMSSINVTLKPADDVFGKPMSLVCILKENKAEIKVKKVNPYQEDLFTIIEIIIEPLERSAERAQTKNISVFNIHYATPIDIPTILSLYGRTSIITQTIQRFQVMIEHSLNQHGYFINKVSVGFFYTADTALLESLSEARSPFFLRDSHRKIFYLERTFFNPILKMKPKDVEQLLNKYLVENIKSVLIVPFFGSENALIGYAELKGSLPNLGNDTLQDNIESANGIGVLVSFLETKTDELTFELELAHVKEWKLLSEKEEIIDLSEDGRGVGLHIAGPVDKALIHPGSKIAFEVKINNINYNFYGNIKNIKTGKAEKDGSILGIKIYSCNQQGGIELLSAYSSQLIGKTF
ncbi:MAG: hypothetical protein K8R21_12660 [Leptospira sp.]|nr:hypothetical protein [Leptospira sp.]